MGRTIRVMGKGSLSVKPDTIRLLLTMEGHFKDYDKAVEQSAVMLEELKRICSGLDFPEDELKTLQFAINAEYESYQDRDAGWRRRLVGYKLTHRVKQEFALDNARLGKLLYELGQAESQPEVQLEYTVRDEKKCKNELLAAAVCDARQNAEVLAGAAGVELGDIVTMDYAWKETDLLSRPMEQMMLAEPCRADREGSVYQLDIHPDDISVSDSVTVIWEIK